MFTVNVKKRLSYEFYHCTQLAMFDLERRDAIYDIYRNFKVFNWSSHFCSTSSIKFLCA